MNYEEFSGPIVKHQIAKNVALMWEQFKLDPDDSLYEFTREQYEATKDTTVQQYFFPNGYGASVINGPLRAPTEGEPLGGFEVGVLKKENDEWIVYKKLELTNTFVSGLTQDECNAVLKEIFELKEE